MYTIHRKPVFALVIFFLFGPGITIYAQDEQYDVEQIKENIIDACREYRLQCSNVQILIELSERSYSTEAFQTGHVRVVYKKNDFLAQQRPIKSGVEVVAKNPSYNFRIVKGEKDTDQYFISELYELGTPHESTPLDDEIKMLNAVRYSPLYVNHLHIEDLAKSSAVEFEEPEYYNSEGSRNVQVPIMIKDSSEEIDGMAINFSNITLYFSPDNYGWVPIQMDYTHATDGTPFKSYKTTDYYSEHIEKNGVMIPTRIIREFSQNEEPPFEGDRLSLEWNFDPPSEEEFYLSHYGLPEPDFAKQMNYRPWIVAGVALLILFLVYYFARRRRAEA